MTLMRELSERSNAILRTVTGPITAPEVGELLGLPSTTVNRYLQRLEKAGYITKKVRGIYEPIDHA